MPHLNWDKYEDAQDFSPLPEGDYVVAVTTVKESISRQKNEVWNLTLTVIEGEYTGRFIWDNLTFSPEAMSRTKLVCKRLGIDTSGEVDFQPEMLANTRARVTVFIGSYMSDGKEIKRNVVPYAGYEAIEVGTPVQATQPSSDNTVVNDNTNDLPF